VNVGHATRPISISVGALKGVPQDEDYTKVTLKKRMEAMIAFPRYRVAQAGAD
jgi:hypothetical protein